MFPVRRATGYERAGRASKPDLARMRKQRRDLCQATGRVTASAVSSLALLADIDVALAQFDGCWRSAASSGAVGPFTAGSRRSC